MLRLIGVLLFAFIPLVLALFLRQPLGPGWSIALGLAIMFGHRFVAGPWAAKYADVRCLWCGRVGGGRQVAIMASGRTWAMTACCQDHERSIARFLRFLMRFRQPIALGIFLPLGWLLVASAAAAAGHPLLRHDTNALIFRVVVAATVVTASLAPFVGDSAPLGAPASSQQPLECPFPLHNLFLLGIRNTLWIFRIVGAWWLIDGAWRLLR
jgi:hypothetical protein